MNRRIALMACLVVMGTSNTTLRLTRAESRLQENSQAFAVKDAMHQLWSYSIQAPSEAKDSTRLDQAIRKVSRMQLVAETNRSAARTPAEVTEPASQPAPQPVATTQPAEMSPEILTKLKLAVAGGTADAAELAEALFLGGQMESAAFFYRKALESEQPPEDRAWLLFQLGNSLLKSDPSAAADAYGQLIKDHPDSLWSELAGIRRNVITWRNANNISQLLEQIQSDGLE